MIVQLSELKIKHIHVTNYLGFLVSLPVIYALPPF